MEYISGLKTSSLVAAELIINTAEVYETKPELDGYPSQKVVIPVKKGDETKNN